MIPFLSKMYLNRWRLGLRHIPRWVAYNAPQTPSCDGVGYEICEFTEFLGLPGCVPYLTGNNVISLQLPEIV